MGMAASQARFLGLTSRKNDIQGQLSNLSAQKMSLTRDMNKVTREYQASISSKKLQMSCGSANYVDLSYSNMMTPNSLTKTNPYILTDMKGKVVVDDKYRQYAEMISSDGTPGDWEDCRSEVLARLTGLNEEDIENADFYYNTFLDNQQALYELDESEPSKGMKKVNLEKFLKEIDTYEKRASGNPEVGNFSQGYKAGWTIENRDDLDNLMGTLKWILAQFLDYDGLDEAFESVANFYDENQKYNIPTSWADAIDYVLEYYAGTNSSSVNGDGTFNIMDKNNSNYEDIHNKWMEWKSRREEAKTALDESSASYNSIFTADKESLIKFYDNLFSTIAEKGWTCYAEVSDTEYLNQMLQNGMFNITTVEREIVSNEYGENSYENTYTTDIALNCKNVVQVSDSDARDAALVKYEYEKGIINAKESRIDQRTNELEAENAAIQQMLQSIQNVINNNIEQHMNVFTG